MELMKRNKRKTENVTIAMDIELRDRLIRYANKNNWSLSRAAELLIADALNSIGNNQDRKP